VCETVSFI